MPLCNATRANGMPCRMQTVTGEDKCVHHKSGDKPGAAPKLTPELADRLVALLQAGNYVAVAVREVGISRALFYQWLERGASSAARDVEYVELRERVESAKAMAEARHVASIAKAAREGNWQASAWWLERMYPDRWGRVSVRLRDMPDEDAAQIERVDVDDPFREVDELAELRRTRVG